MRQSFSLSSLLSLTLSALTFLALAAMVSSLNVAECQDDATDKGDMLVESDTSKNINTNRRSVPQGKIRGNTDLEDAKPLWPSDDVQGYGDGARGSQKDTIEKPTSPFAPSLAPEASAPGANKIPATDEGAQLINVPREGQPTSESRSVTTESDQEWKLDLAKKEYSRVPNDQSLSEVLSAYSELIISDCFGAKKQSCTRLVEDSLKLDPFFTPAICAKHGVESKLCLESYQAIRLALIEDSKTTISRKLTLSLDENRQAEILQSMQEQRWNLMREFNQNQTPQALAAILQMFYKELSLVCNREQFFVESLKEVQERSPSTNDPLSALILEPPTPTPIPGGFSRSRRITKACLDLADEALSFAPDFSSAVCAKFGRYSPKCHQSLKNAQAQKRRAEKSGSAPSGSGINELGDASNQSSGDKGLEEF